MIMSAVMSKLADNIGVIRGESRKTYPQSPHGFALEFGTKTLIRQNSLAGAILGECQTT
jgi:hypothetical protein